MGVLFRSSSPPWFHVVLMGGCFAGSSPVSLIRTVVDSVPLEWGGRFVWRWGAEVPFFVGSTMESIWDGCLVLRCWLLLHRAFYGGNT